MEVEVRVALVVALAFCAWHCARGAWALVSEPFGSEAWGVGAWRSVFAGVGVYWLGGLW